MIHTGIDPDRLAELADNLRAIADATARLAGRPAAPPHSPAEQARTELRGCEITLHTMANSLESRADRLRLDTGAENRTRSSD